MLPVCVWLLAASFSFLNLHNVAAQSQMWNELFQAVITLVANVTLPTQSGFWILILSSTGKFFILQKKKLIEIRRPQWCCSEIPVALTLPT